MSNNSASLAQPLEGIEPGLDFTQDTAFVGVKIPPATAAIHHRVLFIGISLTDPNMRRLLDVAWRKNPDKKLGHFIVKLLPKFSDGDMFDEV